MALNIPIKLYYNADGTMYLNGTLNRVPYVMKLSNLTYEVILVAPIDISLYSVQTFFQKADNTTTNGYPMANIGTEEVDGEIWQVFKMTIESAVLNVSAYGLRNELGIGFYITDGNQNIVQTLNSEPFWVKCTYAITGGQNVIDETPLEELQRTLDLALSGKANINDVVHLTSSWAYFISTISNQNNVGYAYLITQDISNPSDPTQIRKKGSIYVKTSLSGVTFVSYGREDVDDLINEVETHITLGYSEVI